MMVNERVSEVKNLRVADKDTIAHKEHKAPEAKPVRSAKAKSELKTVSTKPTPVAKKAVEPRNSIGLSTPAVMPPGLSHHKLTNHPPHAIPKPEAKVSDKVTSEAKVSDITTLVPETKSIDVPKKVTLRDKKRRSAPGVERMTKSLILETDLSDLGPDPDLLQSAVGRSGSILSFTSVPSPYRRPEDGGEAGGGSRITLLSQCSYRNSSPPPKPLRTYTHHINGQLPSLSSQNKPSQHDRSITTISKDEEELLDRLGKGDKEEKVGWLGRRIAGDANNNNLMLKSRFTNYNLGRSRQETLRNIVNLRINTDIFKRFARSEGSGKGKLQKKLSDNNQPPPTLPYLQTLV